MVWHTGPLITCNSVSKLCVYQVCVSGVYIRCVWYVCVWYVCVWHVCVCVELPPTVDRAARVAIHTSRFSIDGNVQTYNFHN
jgi:hypothetical protein